jgi:hypothetical protein
MGMGCSLSCVPLGHAAREISRHDLALQEALSYFFDRCNDDTQAIGGIPFHALPLWVLGQFSYAFWDTFSKLQVADRAQAIIRAREPGLGKE